MKKLEAIQILKEVQGKSYHYMEMWGLSLIKEAVYTLTNRIRKPEETELLEEVQIKLSRKY